MSCSARRWISAARTPAGLLAAADGHRRFARWFVADEAELAGALWGAKLVACEHCRRVGWLVGHGRVLGYAERSSERVVRGRRLFCSDRGRRGGCGRTVAVRLASVIVRHVVRANTWFALFVALAHGARCAAAWRALSAMSLRTGYRLRDRLAHARHALRTTLLSRAPPPEASSASADAQLVAHLRAILGADTGSFDRYQHTFQRSLLA